MQVRCLHCYEPIDVPTEGDLTHVHCSACGGSFSLVGESTASYAGAEARTLGHFELIEQVGVGAFGSVWKARDTRLDRVVAVKIPRAERLDAGEAEMFLREARAAAQLKHPNIVPVHEVGRDGQTLYIVSDFVQGATLDDWLTSRRLTPRESAELCLQIAEALDHAHQSGVIHRDLKPGNIMLDLSGHPHLLDFGLARRPGREATMTVEGRVLGTPAYMSPEQARGEAHTADHRTDIYSLGVVLFRLLTGELPFRGSARMLIVQILQDDPPSPRKLSGHVPRDLETICLKCLEKDPDKRYPTAQTLAAELRSWLAGEPIQAHPITRVARTWRWCKRNRLVAILGAGVIASLLLGTAITGYFANRARNERIDAQTRAYFADMNVAMQAWEENNVRRVLEILRDHRDSKARGFEWYHLWHLCQRTCRTKYIPVRDKAHRVLFSPDGLTLAVGYVYGLVELFDVKTRVSKETLACRRTEVYPLFAFSRDGRRLARADSDDKAVVVDDLVTREKKRLPGNPGTVHEVAFSPDGRLLAVGAGRAVVIWDVDRGAIIRTLDHEDEVWAVSFSLNRNLLVSGSDDGVIKLWDVETGAHIRTIPAPFPDVRQRKLRRIWSLAFSGNDEGKDDLLAAGSGDGTVRIHRVRANDETLLAVLSSHSDEVRSVSFSPKRNVLASASRDGSVKLWELKGFREIDMLRGYSFGGHSCAFSPDGATLASAGVDYRVLLWDMTRADDTVIEVPTAATNRVNHPYRIAFAPDGGSVALVSTLDGGSADVSESGQNVVRVVSTRDGTERGVFHETMAAQSIAVSADGRLALGGRGIISIWDIRKASRIVSRNLGGRVVSALAFNDRDGAVVSGFDDGAILLWTGDSFTNGEPVRFSGHQSQVTSLAFSENGRLLASGGADGLVMVWDLRTRELLDSHHRHRDRVLCLAFSPDGNLLASGAQEHDSSLCVWDLSVPNSSPKVIMSARSVYALAFSPKDGNILFAAHGDNTVRLWDVASEQQRLRLRGHAFAVESLRLSLDGRTLLSGDRYGTVRLWRAASQEQVAGTGGWWEELVPEAK